mgnify:CR=1 FL=1
MYFFTDFGGASHQVSYNCGNTVEKLPVQYNSYNIYYYI